MPVRGDEGGVGVNAFVSASSSQYIVLENPPKVASCQRVREVLAAFTSGVTKGGESE